MDCIDRAIIKGRNVSQFDSLNMQTWEMFERDRNGKKLFLFGTGAVTELFLQNFMIKCLWRVCLIMTGKSRE